MKRRIFLLLLFSVMGLMPVCAQQYELSRKDTGQVQWIKGVKYYLYKVEKGETLYSITRKFGVTEEDLRKNNPDLKDGLKNKMQLLVPAKTLAKKTTPEKQLSEKKVRSEISVGLMVPLQTWKSFIPDTLDEDTTHREIDEETLTELEFYEGVLHAIDSLASREIKIRLQLFDTENDTAIVNRILKNPQTKELDYIIATGTQSVIRRLNQFSVANKIVLLSPSLNATDVMKNNGLGYALSPSSITQCYEAGKMCAGKFKFTNVVVVKSGRSKENDRALAFMRGWNENSSFNCRSIDYSRGEFPFLLSSLVKEQNNLLFIPSSDEDFVNSVMTKLNDTTDVYRVTIIGIPTWVYFESIDPAVMENLHTHLFTASHLDIDEGSTVAFRKFFRNEYLAEPMESAYQGFDAMMLIGNSVKDESTSGGIVPEQNGLFSLYRFKTVNGVNENQFIHMVRYENYKLTEAE